MRRSSPFFLIFSSVIFSACGRAQTAERAATMPAVPFDSVFVLADTLTPEQPTREPLGLVSGIDFGPDGSFVVADVRSSRITRYDANGRLLGVIGRRGRGPGEFQAPMFPIIDDRGQIHVMDLQQPRISVFNPDGTLLRIVSTSGLGRVSEFQVLGGGEYLVAAWAHGGNDLLIRTDSLGNRIASYLPHARIRPEGQPDLPVWGNVRNASLATENGRAYVVSSLADTLWTVDLDGGRATAERITPPGYAPPVAPQENMFNPKAFSRWADSWSAASLVRAGGGSTIVVFVRGVLMRGDSATAAYRAPGGSWQALTGAPIVLAMRGDTVVTLLNPHADRIQLGLYVHR